ncbi:hypothetical protein C3L33_15059, partial [Rhododendron williamsianum]
MATPLLGPPEIRLPIITTTTATTANPPMGFTENNSATYLATGNPCLDFFFHVVPDTPSNNWCNVKAIAEFGYFKDMLEILYRLLEGPEIRKKAKSERQSKKGEVMDRNPGRKKRKATEDKEKVQGLRYNRDPDYRFLHDRVSDLFAELLRSDMSPTTPGSFANQPRGEMVSLSRLLLRPSYTDVRACCEESIPARRVQEYQDIEEAHYAYKVRNRLRREVLSLSTSPEIRSLHMRSKWKTSLQRVPSVAMKLYKKLFYKHERSVRGVFRKGEEREEHNRAGALLPHEIIKSLDDDTGPEVAELQWKRMVDDMAKKGKLTNCMAICDVSGSMEGIPMEVSVALGLLISELSEKPWKGKLITFSANPQLHQIKGDSLQSKTEFIRDMDWGVNTDFQKVFEGSWKSRKYKEKGYEKVPEIVFWNLRNSVATPVPSKQKGVALVSGFSKNLVTLFLEGGGILSPEAVMLQAIKEAKLPQWQTHSSDHRRSASPPSPPPPPVPPPILRWVLPKTIPPPTCRLETHASTSSCSGARHPAGAIGGAIALGMGPRRANVPKARVQLAGRAGTGKSDKEGFYAAALWLHKNHPKTLACNVKAIAEFGYLKDVLEILYRLLEGLEIREKEKMEWQIQKGEAMDLSLGRRKRKATDDKEKVKALRQEKAVAKAKKAFERYNRDSDYRFLHDRVSDLFAELLRSDMESYHAGELDKIGLAAKWCPSLDSSYDRALLMCESVARSAKLKESIPARRVLEYQDIAEAHYAYRVRDRLRKEHDKERFEEYLEKVKIGESTIAAGALLPHEIINPWTYSWDSRSHWASRYNWETDYMAIQKKYKEKGFEKVPGIVFWNLRNSMATPVPSKQEGVALVSGFSKNLVTLFLEGGGILSPEAVMLQAISGKSIKSL